MAKHLYPMRIVDLKDLTKRVRWLKLKNESSETFSFRAGQFVNLQVPQGKDKRPLQRAYSLASSDQVLNQFELLFNYVPKGIASEYIWNCMKGQLLHFTGPFGRLFFKEPPSSHLFFLNTGTGISQHYSYLQSYKKKYPSLNCLLLFGLRYEEDLFYKEEMENLKKKWPHFRYKYVLSRPSRSWQGESGYVQDFLYRTDWKKESSTFYICGNGNMIVSTKKYLLSKGVAVEHILSEAFSKVK